MFDVGRISDELRFVLRRFTADEAVEILEAVAGRPGIEGTGGGCLFSRRIVLLSPSRSAIAVVLEHLATVALLLGMTPIYPSQSFASSAIWPLATAAFVAPRQQRRAAGEHIAVV